MNTNMKPRTVIGILFVVASLLKLATLWGILHWSWFETISEGRWAMYFYIFIILWVGVHLIIDSYRRDSDQWPIISWAVWISKIKIVPFGCNYFAFSATNRIKGFS